MTILALWICDDCDVQHKSKQGQKPIDWASVTVSVDGFTGPDGRANGKRTFEFCGPCSRRFADRIQPSKWPRAGSVMEKS